MELNGTTTPGKSKGEAQTVMPHTDFETAARVHGMTRLYVPAGALRPA